MATRVPSEHAGKTNLTIDSGDQREDGSCHLGCLGMLYGDGVKVWLCRSGHCFPLSSFGTDSSLPQQDESEGQSTGLLSSCLCDRRMSNFLYFLRMLKTKPSRTQAYCIRCKGVYWCIYCMIFLAQAHLGQSVDSPSVVRWSDFTDFFWKKKKNVESFLPKMRKKITIIYQLNMQWRSSLMIREWICASGMTEMLLSIL